VEITLKVIKWLFTRKVLLDCLCSERRMFVKWLEEHQTPFAEFGQLTAFSQNETATKQRWQVNNDASRFVRKA
jgi:hypothetical protein